MYGVDCLARVELGMSCSNNNFIKKFGVSHCEFIRGLCFIVT